MPDHAAGKTGDIHASRFDLPSFLEKIAFFTDYRLMNHGNADKWNKIYALPAESQPVPSKVLEQYSYFLPQNGKALDLACGRGGNALLLAATGLETHAWDISETALSQLLDLANKAELPVNTRQCDLTVERPATSSFDVIVVSNYLDRELCPFLDIGLKKKGLLFYETFIREKSDEIGPKNPEFLLGPNELLHLFPDLHILLYREDGLTGERKQGIRNKAMLIGQKR